MCGFLFTNNPLINERDFKQALSLINHRGPDQTGCYHQRFPFQLGHNRLSILDLDSRSDQPYLSDDGRYAIIFNGEIYNFRELAKKYKIISSTSSDTEILLKLYLLKGKKVLSELNGMFAFIIIDTFHGTFFVARDRLGVKPLYYSCEGNRWIFSSEIRPILELLNSYTIDEFAIKQYKKMRIFFNDRTHINQIKSFPAAHYSENGKFYRYWDLDFSPKEPPSDEELFDLISSAVQYRLIADVSVGSYLSGGLDSTIITALSNVQHTWTVGFSSENEFKWSNLAAEKYQTQHHAILIDKDEFLTLAKEMIHYRKCPISVPNEVLLYKMTKEVKKYNKVVLSGEGSDELFFGYDRIFRWAESNAWDMDEFSDIYSYGSSTELDVVEDALQPFMKYQKPIDRVASFFQIAHLHGLLQRLDNATMLCGVEARSPFVDYRLVERMAGVGFDYKMKDNIVKEPLKRVFEQYLPKEIIQRPKKGFPVPISEVLPGTDREKTPMDRWFEFNLKELMEVL